MTLKVETTISCDFCDNKYNSDTQPAKLFIKVHDFDMCRHCQLDIIHKEINTNSTKHRPWCCNCKGTGKIKEGGGHQYEHSEEIPCPNCKMIP